MSRLYPTMTSEHQKQSGYNNGLISILKEFTRSVDTLNKTVLFPVRLQDMDINSVTNSNDMAEVFKHCFNDKQIYKDLNLYELYMLLSDTKTDLITGSDAEDGRKSTLFHQDLRRIMETVKQLTDLSEIVRMNYETSLMLPRNG